MHKLFFSSPFTFLTQQLCAFKDDQVPQVFNLDGHRHTPSNRNTGQSGQDAQVLCKLLTVAVPRGCPKHRENKRMAHTCWIVSFTKTASLQKTKYFRRESMCFYSRGNHFSLLVICTIKKEEGVGGGGVVLHLKKWLDTFGAAGWVVYCAKVKCLNEWVWVTVLLLDCIFEKQWVF